MALVRVNKGGANKAIGLLAFIIVAVVLYFFVVRRPEFQDWVNNLLQQQQPSSTTTPTQQQQQSTETVQGDTPYPGTKASDLDDQGQGTRHYASGKPDDVTHEWEGNTSAQSYMIVIDITLTEIAHDDQISFKYGGTHNGSGWYDAGYDFESGKACLGKEENHPSTDLCVSEGTSIGSLVNKPVKLAAINMNKGEKLELWSNSGQGWQKDIEGGPGVGGFRPSVDEDQVLIRIDAAPGIEMRSAAIYELSGTGTPTTTTTEGEQQQANLANTIVLTAYASKRMLYNSMASRFNANIEFDYINRLNKGKGKGSSSSSSSSRRTEDDGDPMI